MKAVGIIKDLNGGPLSNGVAKSSEPMFGRKVPSDRTDRRKEVPADYVRLSLKEIGNYVVAAARARGYPESFLPDASRWVQFLEARGLPGFYAFAREMLGARSETLQQRAQIKRPNGSVGGQCPMTDSVRISEKLDAIVALPPGQAATYPMPSNPLLMVPRLASYAGANGLILNATFYVDDVPTTHLFFDGHRTTFSGPYAALLDATNFGISRFPEETNGVPPLRAAHFDAIEFPVAMLCQFVRRIEELQ